jgi:hypothetical protein
MDGREWWWWWWWGLFGGKGRGWLTRTGVKELTVVSESA